MLSYVTTLNLVRLGIKHKVKFIKIPKNNKSTKLLNILIRFNIILGWLIIKNQNNFNYLVYCNHKITNIYTFVKANKKLILKYKYIKILINRYSTSTIFLSTSKGILSINEAHKKKIGGFLFFRIV